MEFKITEAEAREMAQLEEECGCDISAGPDWGIHLDKVLALALPLGNSAEPTLCEHNKPLSEVVGTRKQASEELRIHIATEYQTE
jgi:hypothetical protein